MNLKNCIYVLLFFSNSLISNNITKAYNALSIYDYFKAKSLFYKSYKKNKAEAAYGLAIIYCRTDNPFSNIDSAAKYINSCLVNFKDTVSYNQFKINNNSISQLKYDIGNKGFNVYCNNTSIDSINHFLNYFPFASETKLKAAYYNRDAQLYQKTINSQKSDIVKAFILSYPESVFLGNAKKLYDDFQYHELTSTSNINSYKIFLKKHPTNINCIDAEQNLFSLTQQLKNEDSLYLFIEKYASVNTKDYAWKYLYSSTVKNYSKQNLENFLIKYPNYPFKDLISKELQLTERLLIPFKNSHSLFGYIDTLGNWIIPPKFDDASNFCEGLASVCKNDSCFYINKEGEYISENKFDEVEDYKDGFAIVKNNGIYYLINRTGQVISKPYAEINEISEGLYVCKQGDKYGAINTKGEEVIPFIYNKLGNFKNEFAYYYTTLYGLVSSQNIRLEAEWEWVSNVDTNQILIVKKDKKYGLINTNNTTVLNIDYDYITPCQNGIYLIVKNNLYGFYNALQSCFITSIEFNYITNYTPNDYTNGKYFKLHKNEEVALIDANGRYSIPFGMYSNLFFAKCDIIRIQKNNKYSFVDRKLKPITTQEFDKATDFENNIAIVKKSSNSMLLNQTGSIFYTIKNGDIVKINETCYKTINENGLIGLINSNGETLLQNEYNFLEIINSNLIRFEKDQAVFLFNIKTKEMKNL